MSAAGRGERLGGEHDYYSTPAWCVDRLLEWWRPRSGILVEPCVGSGAIVEACKANGVENPWACMDIDPKVDYGFKCDFLEVHLEPGYPRPGCDGIAAVITNPPYVLAEQFVRNCRILYPGAEIVMLLRLNFLGSEDRIQFWKDVGVPKLGVIPNRPIFRRNKQGKKGTDSCEYAWFIWQPWDPSAWPQSRLMESIKILNSTPLAERRKHVV